MNKLRAKLKKEGGFTLIEMLIVVAIIAILIAISIPMVNGALERARDATDQANERAAKAEAMLYYMGVVSDAELLAIGGGTNAYVPGQKLEAFYDANAGSLKKEATGIKAYGKCQNVSGCYQSGVTGASNHSKQIIKIVIDPADAANPGVAVISWVDAS